MKTLEKGNDRIKKICSVLRQETLEPAQKEAREIIEQANLQAEKILKEAQKAADKLQAEAKSSVEREHSVFIASLQQAAKQSVEYLRQTFEARFFDGNMMNTLEKSTSDPKLVAGIINAIIKALEKDGIKSNLTALVPKVATPRQINEMLLQEVVATLKEGSVVIGDFTGGAKVRLNDKKVTIDLSADALKELLASHVVRKDFRQIVFGKS